MPRHDGNGLPSLESEYRSEDVNDHLAGFPEFDHRAAADLRPPLRSGTTGFSRAETLSTTRPTPSTNRLAPLAMSPDRNSESDLPVPSRN